MNCFDNTFEHLYKMEIFLKEMQYAKLPQEEK